MLSSSVEGPVPIEERKPSFLKRPVPLWAFLLLVVLLVILFVIPAFTPLPPSVQQPLIVTPETRTVYVDASQTTANFTVANLNITDAISATATATILPTNANITLTMAGVQTRNTFVASSDGKTVTFPPGASTLVVKIVPNNNRLPANYTVTLHLVD